MSQPEIESPEPITTEVQYPEGYDPDSQKAMESEPTSIMQVISRAASDPQTDVDKLERLMGMYERMEAKKAEVAFNAALSALQNDLPEIAEGGEIKHNGRLISQYARWDEDINPVIKPILARHGFSLSFRIDTNDGVNVEAVLAHSAGHSERTSIHLPADTSGSKNPVQAVASSVSYGKRYTAGALLNLTACGQDDDGNAAASPQRVSDEQAANIRALIEEVGANEHSFCKYMMAQSVDDIRADQYNHAIQALEKKRGK